MLHTVVSIVPHATKTLMAIADASILGIETVDATIIKG